MLDLAHLINHHRSDTAAKAELIKREIAEIAPAIVIETPVISYDRHEMFWRPIDPQVEKAMEHARQRIAFYTKELRRKKR
jgi:hypothetical protein